MPKQDRQPQQDTAAASQQALTAGALPIAAQARLAQETGGRRFFASDLSVSELVLVEAAGLEPLGVVMGSSVYQVGLQWQVSGMGSFRYGSYELDVITAAHVHARALAMERMEREAAALGANGVVGVRLTTRGYEDEQHILQFSAIGTAVRLRAAPPVQRLFLSDLSGEEFWTLLQSGYAPVGIALGFCSYFVAPMYSGSNWLMGNVELPEYVQGVYQARRLAMGRLTAELPALGATGVVGVMVDAKKHLEVRETSSSSSKSLTLRIDFFAMGTAIAPMPERARPSPPLLALNLMPVLPKRAQRTAAPAGVIL